MPDNEVRVEVDGRTLTISNLDKVLYPNTETTKGEVLSYYAQVAPVMIPLIGRRAVTRIRWPHGTGDGSFFEKNAPAGTPSWVRTVKVPSTGSRSGKGDTELVFPVVDDLATLTWLVNLAALELLEVDVPQPGHVLAVGRNRVDGQHDRVGGGQRQCLDDRVVHRGAAVLRGVGVAEPDDDDLADAVQLVAGGLAHDQDVADRVRRRHRAAAAVRRRARCARSAGAAAA